MFCAIGKLNFLQLKPVKRRGNRRYYQRQDVILIRQIKSLLYEQGYTIGGARQKMSDNPEELVKSNVNASEIRSLVKDLESVKHDYRYFRSSKPKLKPAF